VEAVLDRDQTSTELVRSVSIANLVNQREAVRVALTKARQALLDVDAVVKAIDGDSGRTRHYMTAASLVTTRGNSYCFRLLEDEGIAAGMRDFDAAAWQYLMHGSGLRSLMDATAREAWDKAIDKSEHPELTATTIETTFREQHASRGDMFERGVIQCFRQLSWNYKTNLPQKFGKRIVLTSITGYHCHKRSDELDDLLRVMHILDGKPEPDHRSGSTYALMAKAGLTYSNRQGTVETDYIRLRSFKNCNGHVTFKRLDLVDKMNSIIARHYPGALPEPKG
jgi:hypothetical protein